MQRLMTVGATPPAEPETQREETGVAGAADIKTMASLNGGSGQMEGELSNSSRCQGGNAT